MDSNQRKAETLGMNASTANSLLRRNIIFELLTGTRWMDWGVCYKCKDAIMSPEELSIEHKQPWEGRENGKELYWDLENIDFSHKRCNTPHRYVGGIGRRIQSPEGQVYCTVCKQHKSVVDFRKNSKNWTGYARVCRYCNNLDKKKWAGLHKQ